MNPPITRLVLRIGGAVALLLVGLLEVSAADTGTITGRISNSATGAYLEGAEVTSPRSGQLSIRHYHPITP